MVTPEDVVQRVRSYIDHQATKGPGEVRQLIERTVGEFDERLAGVSEEQARFKPAADEWSVVEVLSHISSVTAFSARVIAALARGEMAPLTSEGPGAPVSLAALRERMADAWAAVHQSIEGLPAEPDLSATFAHPAFGEFNCMQWLVFVRVHALDHAQQIDKIKSDSRYPAT